MNKGMAQVHDVEAAPDDSHLYNDNVESVSWKSVGVHLPDKATKARKDLLWSVSGDVKAGEWE